MSRPRHRGWKPSPTRAARVTAAAVLVVVTLAGSSRAGAQIEAEQNFLCSLIPGDRITNPSAGDGVVFCYANPDTDELHDTVVANYTAGASAARAALVAEFEAYTEAGMEVEEGLVGSSSGLQVVSTNEFGKLVIVVGFVHGPYVVTIDFWRDSGFTGDGDALFAKIMTEAETIEAALVARVAAVPSSSWLPPVLDVTSDGDLTAEDWAAITVRVDEDVLGVTELDMAVFEEIGARSGVPPVLLGAFLLMGAAQSSPLAPNQFPLVTQMAPVVLKMVRNALMATDPAEKAQIAQAITRLMRLTLNFELYGQPER